MELRQRRKINDISTNEVTSIHPSPRDPVATTITAFCLIIKLSLFIIFLLVVGYLTSPIDPEKLSWVKRIELDGKLKVNKRLTKGVSIDMLGPECVVEDDEKNIYTGLSNGQIIRISPGPNYKIGAGRHEIFFISRFPGAVMTDPKASHGRPLGMRIRDGKLYVMDALYGLYNIDLKSRKVNFIVKPNDVKPNLVLPDDFDITADGQTIYFSDATTRFPITYNLYAVIEGKCTGRIFEYDVGTKIIRKVKDKLCFANGVQLNKNEKTSVVAETIARRIIYLDTGNWVVKYRLHLPTIPDNIRINKRGNYWIGTTGTHTPLSDFFFDNPRISRLIAGVIPYSILKKGINDQHSILVEANSTGKILQVLHDEKKQLIAGLSHAIDLSDGRVALGSFTGDRLAIIDYEDPPRWMLHL